MELEFRVEFAEESEEATDRWRKRTEYLAAWLAAEWQREHHKEQVQ